MFRRKPGEEPPVGGASRLQAVFSKLSGVLPMGTGGQDVLGCPPKTMTKDIIESVLAADTPVPAPPICHYDGFPPADERGLCLTLPALSHRLEGELRSAKRTHLSCGEVLIPCGLLYRIARDILAMAESEPYGIRGCVVHVNFEAPHESRRLSTVKSDPGTATTFELNLTLKQSAAGWNFIPQFLKNFTRGGTIVVSQAYTLSKKKLYRSICE